MHSPSVRGYLLIWVWLIVGQKSWYECFEFISEHMMTSFDSEAAKLLTSSMREILTSESSKLKCCWHPWNFGDIVDRLEKVLSFNTDHEVLKDYQKCVKKAMSIIGLNLCTSRVVRIEWASGCWHCERTRYSRRPLKGTGVSIYL